MITFISAGELVIIFFVVLLLFGAKSIPDIAKTLGKTYSEVQRYTNDLKREFSEDTQVLDAKGDEDIRDHTDKADNKKKNDEFLAG